mgnify:CR=1 FL=1
MVASGGNVDDWLRQCGYFDGRRGGRQLTGSERAHQAAAKCKDAAVGSERERVQFAACDFPNLSAG